MGYLGKVPWPFEQEEEKALKEGRSMTASFTGQKPGMEMIGNFISFWELYFGFQEKGQAAQSNVTEFWVLQLHMLQACERDQISLETGWPQSLEIES